MMHYYHEYIYIVHKEWKPIYEKAMGAVIELSKEEEKKSNIIIELEALLN
jgi:hypothetical protein